MRVSNHFENFLNFADDKHVWDIAYKYRHYEDIYTSEQLAKHLINLVSLSIDSAYTNYGIVYNVDPDDITLDHKALLKVENKINEIRDCYRNSYKPTFHHIDMFGEFKAFVDYIYYIFIRVLNIIEDNGDNQYKHEVYMLTQMLYNLFFITLIFSDLRESVDHVKLARNSKDQNPNRDKPRRIAARFGRTIQTLFPGLPHFLVDMMNDNWATSHKSLNEDDFFFHFGENRKAFAYAYQLPKHPCENLLNNNEFKKHLATSCLQYEKSNCNKWDRYTLNSGIHCVEAYAIDDEYAKYFDKRFKILYLTDKEDKFSSDANLLSRVVYSESKDGYIEWGPIYASSEFSYDLMLKKMKLISLSSENEYFKANYLKFFEYPNEKINESHYWINTPMTPYYNGEHLSIEKYNSLIEIFAGIYADDRYVPLSAPYIDCGSRRFILLPHTESGMMFLYATDKHYQTIENYLYYSSIFSGHCGVNHVKYKREVFNQDELKKSVTNNTYVMYNPIGDIVINNNNAHNISTFL